MKANELRIGNYYHYAGDNGIIYTKVKEIKHNQFGLLGDFDGVNFEICKPIELTEEWLLKFGFNKKVDEYVFQDYAIEDIHNGVTWILKKFDYDSVCFVAIGKGINYVHQLQNLYFALTGEELTHGI